MKTLILYYSYTGNTKVVAHMIQKELNCDIYELQPIEPYESNYDSLVEEYKENLVMKPLAKLDFIPIDFNKYDVIILGTPVWWYTITPIMRSLLNVFDFSDKKVYVFATNAGEIGETFNEYKELCPNIEKELNVVFDSNSSTHEIKNIEEVTKWIQSIK